MGVVPNITADRFPKQATIAGRRVAVCFHYDTSRQTPGTIVRADAEAPGVTIIRLDDGRFVLDTECQWQPAQ